MSTPRRGGGGGDGSSRGRGRGRGGGTLRNGRAATPASDDESKSRLEARRVRFAEGNNNARPARGGTAQRARRGRDGVQQPQPRTVAPTAPTTLHASMSYPQKYVTLKRKREHEREEGIKSGLIADPDKPRLLSEAIKPVGNCPDMCPEYERVQRIVEKDVWGAETELQEADGTLKPVPAEHKMVKKFRRAAAGMDEQLPSDLRPPTTLQKTVRYLFSDLIAESDTLASVHHFLWDRTRAIRNDFSIQQLTKIPDVRIAIECYEEIARFHILSLHQFALAEKPYDQYDSFQERQQLDRTLLSLMQYYDDNRERYRSPNEAEFRAYCIIFQLQARIPDLEDRVQSWPSDILMDRRVQQALKLYHAASNVHNLQGPLEPKSRHLTSQGSWGRFWNLVASPRTSYLMACVAEIFFGMIREAALRTIWKSYRPGGPRKIEDWIVEDLEGALGFDKEGEVVQFCEGYGFVVGQRADGKRFIDLASVPGKVFPSPTGGMRDQRKSVRLVEKKRIGRTLTAVIYGLSVKVARDKGEVDSLVDSEEGEHERDEFMEDDGNSLFVKDPEGKAKEKEAATGFLNSGASAFEPKSSPGIFTGGGQPPAIPQNSGLNGVFNSPQPFTSAFGKPQPSPSGSGSFFGSPNSQMFPPPQRNPPDSSTNKSSPLAFGAPSGFNPPKTSANQSTSPFAPKPASPNAANGISKSTGTNQSIFSTSAQAPSSSGSFQFSGGSQQQSQNPTPPQVAAQTGQDDLAAQQKAAGQQRIAEQQRIVEQQRIAEQQRAAEQKRLEEQRRQEELRKAEVLRQIEDRRKAEEAAKQQVVEAKKRRKSETYDYLAHELVLNRRDGFMRQFVEFISGPLITNAMMEWEDEKLCQEADEFRSRKLAKKYGTIWHRLSYSLKHRRRGHERRIRIKEARMRRSTGEPLASSIFADSFRRSQPELDRSDHGVHSEGKDKERLAGSINGKASSTSQLKGILKNSVNPSSRPPTNHRRSQTQPSAHFSHANSTTSTHPPIPSPLRNASLGSSTFTPSYRTSTTKSDYFRLKARGIPPSLVAQPPSRKRNWDQANDDPSPTPTGTHAPSPPRKPFQQVLADDEALFARVRTVTQAMDDSIAFFREEREKEAARLRSSAGSSGGYTGPSMSPSSGAGGINAGSPPRSLPKYYGRVSKFVPKEEEEEEEEEELRPRPADMNGKGKERVPEDHQQPSQPASQGQFVNRVLRNVSNKANPPPASNSWPASGTGMSADDAIELD
ncbi:hypothetical protein P152DRAFT_481606 [Eremomyces bilateralis CBS 781.70]|uniref:SAC3/GANP/THP3 conserved domain-containing protein n=1 Tax=Eremomyces bilateralis CBS 781.70 TaxID=1392243 RepID=A0A6G1G6H2_9PEZI|nr:uncharacterized protein P152DRAFT_481606 [Eremomyces bilateralis CBS 781.70]KAF1813526.1 hypothetical protein P152DRAFT_481606 [Eremomyces bilateralis CBS 781.70]